MNYPTKKEVEDADQIQLCRWYRFLRRPENKNETIMLNLISKRHKEMGGFTPEISKMIGW